ncbi:MAG: MocR-like pyridoxine biosynthesis transcription factor PdxR [Vulcanimicrobiaceae bacterium]
MLLRLGPERPLYRAVYNAVRTAILSGQLTAGTRLPGTRSLARQLGVSRIVVLAAFERLTEEGYIVSSAGSGSRIAVAQASSRQPAGDQPPIAGEMSAHARRVRRLMPHESPIQNVRADLPAVDFRYATFIPDGAALRAWRQSISRACAQSQFEYPNPAGLGTLRGNLCEYLRRHRGLNADPDDILIVSGSQQALDLTARALGERGAAIGIEDPHYQGARQAFLAAGARLVPCAVDEDGFDIERHQKSLREARAIYVTPSHQFPTGAIMSIERRLKLLSWAAAHRVWVIEDDYDSEFRYGSEAIPALQGLDRRRCVIYIGTVVRTLSPGLRLGYVVVPPMLREVFRAMKWLADRGTSPLEQRALAAFIDSGAYDRAQRRMARGLAQRRDRLFGALHMHFNGAGVTWSGSGAHAFLRLQHMPARDADRFVDHAVQRGVRLYTGTPYYLRAPKTASLVCGFATLTPDEIDLGIERLAKSYESFEGR